MSCFPSSFNAQNTVKIFHVLSQNFSRERLQKVLVQKGLRVISSPKQAGRYYILECSLRDQQCHNTQCVLSDPATGEIIYHTYGELRADYLSLPKILLLTTTCLEQSLKSALIGLDKYLIDEYWQTSPNSVPVDVIGIDDRIKENRRTDYHQAVFDAKVKAVHQAGSRILQEQRLYMSSENSYAESWEDEETELLIDSVLLPGFTIEDRGYIGHSYQVRLQGHIIIK